MGNTKSSRPTSGKHVALLLVEGDTEEEFYKELAKLKFNSVPKKIKNLKGNYNVNAKILDAASQFSINNADDTFDVYVCIDQEKLGEPAYSHDRVCRELAAISGFRSIYPVVAILMLESLFFIDIDGLYSYLRSGRSHRNPRKYSNYRHLNAKDLNRLFKQFGKCYYKGIRCKGLIDTLDLDRISSTAEELVLLVKKINES